MDEDDALMERARKGDTVAFDAIVRRHQHRVQRFAIRMAGGDPARGADVAVGTFLRLWETRATYRSQGKLVSWLLRTAYRLVVDEARRAGSVGKRADLETEETGLRVERSALAQAIRDAIAELPEGQRVVIVLSVYEGLSQETIAETMDVPLGTVASRKSLALKTLRRRLAAWEDPQ